MKRILKLMARLYPSAWRRRYGAEYEALLEETEPHVIDVFDVFWGAARMQMTSRSLVKVVLPCALAGTLISVGISFASPKVYRSRALISVSTTDQRLLDRQLMGDTQELLTEPNLTAIIEKDNLYSGERARMSMSDLLQSFRKNIWIRPVQTSDGKAAPAFILEFQYPDPHMAQRVDQELVAGFTAINLRAAIADPSSGSSHVALTEREPADLPQKPILPNRGKFGAGGLLGGFAAGLILAMMLARHRPDVLHSEL